MDNKLADLLAERGAKVLWVRRVRSVRDQIEIHVLAHEVGSDIVVLEIPNGNTGN